VTDVSMAGGRLCVTLAAAAISGGAAIAVRPIAAGLAPIVAGLVVAGLVGIVYLGAAWWLRVPEARRMVQLVTRHTRPGADSGG
jgi:hypothetical protein